MAEIGGEANMKRIGNLWPGLISFENLTAAAQLATAGKRSRQDVAAFNLNLEWGLLRLQRELREGTYKPGPYHSFIIEDPKPRRISAAPFRDRVIHHALTRVLEPIFERRFSKDSFACRKGMGTHRALERAKEGARRYRYVLKCDIRKYFASMDHEILKGLLARVVKCRPTLDLAGRIIEGSNPQEEVTAYYPGDNLFTPYERTRGLPLGNQTSQFFANVYLDPMDQMVNRELTPGLYVRYVDDFLLFEDSKERLREMREAIVQSIWKLRLDIHPGKSRIYRTADGFGFLGWRVFRDHSRLAKDNIVRFRKRIRDLESEYAQGELAWKEVRERVQAWIAHAAHGDTWKLRERLLAQFSF
jgi:retron-type reverse transcriptase